MVSETAVDVDDESVDCVFGCIYQDGHDGDCLTDEDIAEERLYARDYEAWARL
jgi:hypothetical protein